MLWGMEPLTAQKVLMVQSLLVDDQVKLLLKEPLHLGRFLAGILVDFLPNNRLNVMYCKHKSMTTTL